MKRGLAQAHLGVLRTQIPKPHPTSFNLQRKPHASRIKAKKCVHGARETESNCDKMLGVPFSNQSQRLGPQNAFTLAQAHGAPRAGRQAPQGGLVEERVQAPVLIPHVSNPHTWAVRCFRPCCPGGSGRQSPVGSQPASSRVGTRGLVTAVGSASRKAWEPETPRSLGLPGYK